MKDSKKFTEQREAALGEIKKLADKAEAESRELTVEELSMRDEYAAQAGKLFVRAQSAKAEEAAAKEAKAAEARTANGTGESTTNDAGIVHVRNGEHTYTKGGEFDYMADLGQAAIAAVTGMPSAASARLRQHAKEVSVDAEAARQRVNAGSGREWSARSTSDDYLVGQARSAMAAYGLSEYQARTGDLTTVNGAGGEFVPPAYLVAQYVPFARAGRVFADSVHQSPLPGGTMSLNIPRVTAGTSVASQGTQNTAISDTALQTAYDTIPVVTWAGAQTLSQQLVDRAPIDFSDITFKDLTAALAAQVDTQCINGSGGSGQVLGALNTLVSRQPRGPLEAPPSWASSPRLPRPRLPSPTPGSCQPRTCSSLPLVGNGWSRSLTPRTVRSSFLRPTARSMLFRSVLTPQWRRVSPVTTSWV